MAEFTLKLFDIGDHVSVANGEYKGAVGTVVNWGHIGPNSTNTIHVVLFDKPFEKEIINKVQMDGKVVTTTETINVAQAEINKSDLVLG